jgi:hypothetical protein
MSRLPSQEPSLLIECIKKYFKIFNFCSSMLIQKIPSIITKKEKLIEHLKDF